MSNKVTDSNGVLVTFVWMITSELSYETPKDEIKKADTTILQLFWNFYLQFKDYMKAVIKKMSSIILDSLALRMYL